MATRTGYAIRIGFDDSDASRGRPMSGYHVSLANSSNSGATTYYKMLSSDGASWVVADEPDWDGSEYGGSPPSTLLDIVVSGTRVVT